MSTILKALKKLEQSGSPYQGSSSKVLDARQAFQRVLKPKFMDRTAMKWFGILLVLAVASGAYLFLENPTAGPSRKTEAASQTLQDPRDERQSAVKPRQLSGTDEPHVSNQKVYPMPEERTAREIASPVTPAESFPAALPGNVPGSSSFPVVPPTTPGNTPARQTFSLAAAPEPLNQAAAVPPPRPEKAKQPAAAQLETDPQFVQKSAGMNATRLTDGRLKVQAIVWAPAPEDRMTVVNDSILREGLTIDAFLVVEIKKDSVLVREGDKFWTVPFGAR